jgi:hypothetical protein
MIRVAVLARVAIASVASIGCVAQQIPGEGTSPASVVRGKAQAFTYSIIETTSETVAVLSQVQARIVPMMVNVGATLYSVWLPTHSPEGALSPDQRLQRLGGGFAGLDDSQLGLMLAWPQDKVRRDMLECTLRALDGVGAVTTRIYDPIYLSDGLNVPTGRGFYVHREERYRPGDVDEVIKLSKEAWKTYEPTFGMRVIGLFRERYDSADVARLLRIAWYRSSEAWSESRDFQRDPESMQRLIKRARLELEGSGVAIATDRAVR